MADMGHDFRAPKHSDIKQWEKVRLLYAHGFTFHSCGCCGPGLRPEHLKEVWDFIEQEREKSVGERLLKIIDESVRSRQ